MPLISAQWLSEATGCAPSRTGEQILKKVYCHYHELEVTLPLGVAEQVDITQVHDTLGFA
jgi:hypothetical protein